MANRQDNLFLTNSIHVFSGQKPSQLTFLGVVSEMKKWFDVLKRIIILSVFPLSIFFAFKLHNKFDYASRPSDAVLKENFNIVNSLYGGRLKYIDKDVMVNVSSTIDAETFDEAQVIDLLAADGWVYKDSHDYGRFYTEIFCKYPMSFQLIYGDEKVTYGVWWTAQTHLPESCRSTNEIEMEDDGK